MMEADDYYLAVALVMADNRIRELEAALARVERGGAEPDAHFWCVKHKAYDAYADGTCARVEVLP